MDGFFIFILVVVVNVILSEGISTSTGSMTLIPYTNLNGVLVVASLTVVRADQSMPGKSSTNEPLAPASIFFDPFRMTLFAASAFPFVCGRLIAENLVLIPNRAQ